MSSEGSGGRGPILGVGVLLLVALAWWLLGAADGGGDPGEAPEDAAASDGDGVRATKLLGIDRSGLLEDRGASIAGTVMDEGGEPIPEPLVCVRAHSRELSSMEMRDPACIRGERDGTYRIEGLMPVRYTVAAMAPTFIPASYDPPGTDIGVKLQPGVHRDGVDIVLEGGGVKIEGVVKDLSGGVIEGAMVSSRAGGGGFFFFGDVGDVVVTTDADGRFETWVKPGGTTVSAVADGYTTGRDSGPAPGHRFEVLLTPESVLVGKVVEAGTNVPVEGARVHSRGDWNDRWRGDTFTDAEGKFRIDRLEPGRYKPIAETDAGFGMAAEAVELGLGETSEEVLVELHPALTVEGSVSFTDGEPCEEAWVSLTDKKNDLSRNAESDTDGSVIVRGVFPGTYEVGVYCDNASSKQEYASIEVVDEPVTGVEWTVERGMAIRGIVVGPDGEGMGKIGISAQMKGGKARGPRSGSWGQTEKDGTFELKGLLAGSYTVSVSSWGERLDHPTPKEPTEVEITEGADTEDVRIELERGAAIVGRVVDENGDGVASVTVRASGKEAAWGKQATTTDGGDFEIKGLRPGRYRVLAAKGWRQEMRAPGQTDDDIKGEYVTVGAGEEGRVELVIENKDGVISGQVVDEDGGPIADAFINVQRESERAGANAGSARRQAAWGGGWWRGDKPVLSDVDGNFEVTGLAPGKYTVHAARRGGGEAVTEHVELGSEVVLAIQTDASISGTVVLAGGGLPERFSVSVQDKKQGTGATESFFRSQGAFTIQGVPAGTYEVTATAPEGTGKVEKVEVMEGAEVQNVLVEVQGLGTLKGRIVSLEDGAPVPDRMVMASPMSGGFRISDVDFQKGSHISDDNGEFLVEHVPVGKVRVMAWPRNWETDDYTQLTTTATVEAGKITDLGELRLAPRRVHRNEQAGDLGFTTKEGDPEKEWDEQPIEVALVRPGGPAAGSGLEAGDVIVEVEGENVEKENRYLYWSLARVPEGQTVKLGIQGGKTVRITAGPPL